MWACEADRDGYGPSALPEGEEIARSSLSLLTAQAPVEEG